MIPLIPFHDRVIVIRDAPKTKTEAGLSILHDKPNTGQILRVGARCQEAKENTRVMFGRNSGTDLTINEQTVLILRECDLILDTETLQTFQDKVLIKSEGLPKEVNGIIIPDSIEENPMAGEVVSVGHLCLEAKVGQRILHGKFAGMKVNLKNQDYLVLREEDIFSLLTSEEKVNHFLIK